MRYTRPACKIGSHKQITTRKRLFATKVEVLPHPSNDIPLRANAANSVAIGGNANAGTGNAKQMLTRKLRQNRQTPLLRNPARSSHCDATTRHRTCRPQPTDGRLI